MSRTIWTALGLLACAGTCMVASVDARAATAAYPNRILDGLIRFQPGLVSRSVTNHDQWGGNGDGGGQGVATEGEYRVLFHGRGEGRIERIWMTCEPEHQARDYQELWIVVDGQTVYRGSVLDYFQGKGPFQAPLVLSFDQSSGGFLSYVPFGYAHEAKVLFKGDPHYYHVTYREGTGSSAGPTPDEISRFLTEDWVAGLPRLAAAAEPVLAGHPLTLASGEGTVLKLALRAEPAKLARLRVRVGVQAPVPALFFFGLGLEGVSPDVSFRNALFAVDAERGFVASRLPVPLSRGERVVLETDSAEPIRVEVASETGAPHPGVRFVAQFRDQRGPGTETTMPFFESPKAVQFVSLVEEISDGPAGSREYLEGDEMIRTDAMRYPLQLGTGTEDYFNGGWYFLGVHANPLAGQPRFNVLDPEDGWSHARFEHSLYRHHVLDPVVGRAGVRFGMEAGTTGAFTPIRYRTLGLAYEFDRVRRVAGSTRLPVAGDHVVSAIDAERNQQPVDFVVERHRPSDRLDLEMDCPAERANGAFLVRDYDAQTPDQAARVLVRGKSGEYRVAGVLYEAYSNAHRRFAQDGLWIDLQDGDCEHGKLGLRFELSRSSTEWDMGELSAQFYEADAETPTFTQEPAKKVFDTSGISGGPYYVNDHTFVRAADGRWHLFGIYNHEPINADGEIQLIHAATADGRLSPAHGLVAEGTALSIDRARGETHLWAPHVVADGQGRYVMAFQAGGPDNDRARIQLAVSQDLEHWDRLETPAFEDVCVARDPMLLRLGATWVMYYTRCRDTLTHASGVAYRISADLIHWSAPSMAISLQGATLFNSGYTESPFVFERDGWFYLSFTSYPVDWNATFVYRSRTPFRFDSKSVARLVAHAGEWIAPHGDYDHDDLLLSTAGAGQAGVSVSRVRIVQR